MGPDITEYLVGAFLERVLCCQFVHYNVRPLSGGWNSLREIDVVGLDLSGRTKRAYLCEVTAHLRGHLGGNAEEAIGRLQRKFAWHRQFAIGELPRFSCQSMLWAPNVSGEAAIQALQALADDGVLVLANESFFDMCSILCSEAERATQRSENPAFRLMQVLVHS
jgi:hypothetical protein